MTKHIEFHPQGNPTTEALKLSVAIQLLYNRICTMEVQFQEDPSQLSFDDWEDFITSSKFLNEVGGKNLKSWESVEAYLALEYAEISRKYENHPTR